MSKGGFGAAKPLPGQAGYRVSASQALEREAMEMENRLKLLQERMQSEDEKPKKSGGSHWKTARTDRGGVTTYAKDVHEINKKKKTTQKVDPSTKATAAARRTKRQESSGGFGEKEIDHWSVGDVGDWLDSVLLSQYKDVFIQNQISGPILLDISLEDLDYMSITALGHRKIILKGIEDLRQNRRVTKQLFAPSADAKPTPTAANRASKSSEGRVAKESNSLARDVSASKQAPAPKVHWSALEPLSANEVSGNEGDYDMVNGADGGMLDEEAERKAFQEAVMAWRSGGETTEKGGKSLSLTGYGQTEEGSGDNGMWSNPFGGDVQAVSSEVGLGVGEGDVVMVSARGQRPSDDGQMGRGGNGSGHGGKKLGDGVLDEEREQAEFRAAVEAWRTGKPKEAGTKSMAQKLAEDMDRQLQMSSKKLQEDQSNMRHQIDEASRALAEAKKRLESEEKQSFEYTGSMDDEDFVMEEYSPSRSTSEHQQAKGLLDDDDDGKLSPSLSIDDSDSDDEHAQSHVEVALIESTLNTGDVTYAPEAKGSSSDYCVVEEPSSDEEEERADGKEEKEYDWRVYNGSSSGGVEVEEITSK